MSDKSPKARGLSLARPPSSSGSEPSAPGLRIENLTTHYNGRPIFQNLTLSIPPATFVALLGPSGVGKTTLLKTIAGLIPLSVGRITATDGRKLQHRIAYMAQQDLLYPWLSVIQNVMLGARLRGEPRQSDRAHHLLARVGLADSAAASPAELSGGMRQRAAIARVLYEDRPIVLMDEPFSALDSVTRARIQDVAAEALQGRTVLLITHDPLEACRLGHYLVVLSGSPAQLGPPIAVPGPTPRAPDDPALLHTQGQLMRVLMALPPQ